MINYTNSLSLGEVWLVSGASRGIGREIVLNACQNGIRNFVITCSKSKQALDLLADELKAHGCNVLEFVGNMGDYEFVKKMYDEIYASFHGIDVLINNAGISHVGLLSDMSYDEWHNVINSNLDSVFNCTKFAIPYMVNKKCGKIINISSVWGVCGASCEVAYSASKGGVNSFTKALAKELAPCNISVNAIAFGFIDTEMNNHLSKEDKASIIDEIPASRLCSPSEAAAFVYRIAASEGYLNGQIIQFDGAWI